MAIGGPDDMNEDFEISTGIVRVYQLNDQNEWQQLGGDFRGKEENDSLGYSVSLSGQGDRVAIGSPFSNNWRGSVEVYQWNGTAWTIVGETINGEDDYNDSGYSVALSTDGNLIAVGAPTNSNDNSDFSGHVRIYQTNETYTAMFTPDDNINVTATIA